MKFLNSLPARVASFAFLTLFASSVSARANTINVTNGSFESTLTTASSQFGAQFTSQQVTGWAGDGYSFVFRPGTADTTGAAGYYGNIKLWGPNDGSSNGLTTSPDGSNYLALDGGYTEGGLAAVSQVLTGLTVGAATTVSFYYAGAQQSGYTGANYEGFDVSLGSQTLDTPVLSNASKGFTGWQQESLTFTATGTTETLKFLAIGGPTGTPPFTLLDGVSVTDNVGVTPEPNSLALLGTGLVCVGGMIRKRFARA